MSMSYQTLAEDIRSTAQEQKPIIVTVHYVDTTDGFQVAQLSPPTAITITDGNYKAWLQRAVEVNFPGYALREDPVDTTEWVDDDGCQRIDFRLRYEKRSKGGDSKAYYNPWYDGLDCREDIPPDERMYPGHVGHIPGRKRFLERVGEFCNRVKTSITANPFICGLIILVIVMMTTVLLSSAVNQHAYKAGLREAEAKMEYGEGSQEAYLDIINHLTTSETQNDPAYQGNAMVGGGVNIGDVGVYEPYRPNH